MNYRLAALSALALSSAAHANLPFTVSLESEAPGIQDSRSTFTKSGVERFDARARGNNQSFTTNFGGTDFTGRYAGVDILNADQYGGAGGTGRYAVTFSGTGYTLDLASTAPGGVTYFGYWLSALDRGNTVTFFGRGKQIFTFNANDARSFINSLPLRNQYYGNPNSAFAGRNTGEPYAFLNFYAARGVRFDRIVFAENPRGGGYESDNHTVGRWATKSGLVIPDAGTGVSIVPEPQTWALMILGFGLVGAALRFRTRPASH